MKVAAARKKAPAKAAPKQTKVSQAVQEELDNQQNGGEEADMVAAMDKQAFSLVMQIIDNANIKGADAGNILQLRMELARVANVQTQPRQ